MDKIGAVLKTYTEQLETKNNLLEKAKLVKNVMDLQADKTIRAKEYSDIEKEYKNLNAEYIDKEDEFFKEQAGILAEKLEENKPCPVCGSTTHPNIAKKSKSVLSKEELDGLKKKLDEKQKDKQLKQAECIKVNSEIITKVKENADCFGNVELENLNLESIKNNIKDEYSKNDVNLKANITLLNSLYKEVTDKDLNIEDFEYDKFKDDVNSSINSEKAELVKDRTLDGEKNKQLQEANIKLEKFQDEYTKALLGLGFKTEEECKKVLMQDVQIENAQKNIDEYNTNVTANKTRISELEELVKGKEKVDLSKVKEELEQDKQNCKTTKICK